MWMDYNDHELLCFSWSYQNVEIWKPGQCQHQTRLPLEVKALSGHNHSPLTSWSGGCALWKLLLSCLSYWPKWHSHRTALNCRNRTWRKTTWQRNGAMNGFKRRSKTSLHLTSRPRALKQFTFTVQRSRMDWINFFQEWQIHYFYTDNPGLDSMYGKKKTEGKGKDMTG